MAALNTWNGGVIVISHDERFITTVAKEVSALSPVTRSAVLKTLFSCGFVRMEPYQSSMVTFKVTRCVDELSMPSMTVD